MNGSAESPELSHPNDREGQLLSRARSRPPSWVYRTGLSSVLFAVLLLSGCQLVAGAVGVVAGAVAFAGYTIYKGGEVVVSGVRRAGSSTSNAFKRRRKTMVVSRGTLKTKAEHSIAELYPAVERVLKDADFSGISGQRDALKASLQAYTSSDELVTVKLELIEANLTAVEIRVGEGSLKHSEYLYDQILNQVDANIRETELW